MTKMAAAAASPMGPLFYTQSVREYTALLQSSQPYWFRSREWGRFADGKMW